MSFYNFIDTDLEAHIAKNLGEGIVCFSISEFAIVGKLGGSASRENYHCFVVHRQLIIYFTVNLLIMMNPDSPDKIL